MPDVENVNPPRSIDLVTAENQVITPKLTDIVRFVCDGLRRINEKSSFQNGFAKFNRLGVKHRSNLPWCQDRLCGFDSVAVDPDHSRHTSLRPGVPQNCVRGSFPMRRYR